MGLFALGHRSLSMTREQGWEAAVCAVFFLLRRELRREQSSLSVNVGLILRLFDVNVDVLLGQVCARHGGGTAPIGPTRARGNGCSVVRGVPQEAHPGRRYRGTCTRVYTSWLLSSSGTCSCRFRGYLAPALRHSRLPNDNCKSLRRMSCVKGVGNVL